MLKNKVRLAQRDQVKIQHLFLTSISLIKKEFSKLIN